MVVDGRIGFTGGVCISDDWMGDGEPGHWRDTHLRVEGPVVAQMQAVFADNWLQMRSEVLNGQDYFPELKPAGTIKAQFIKSGPRDSAENTRIAYLYAIGAARKNIRLAHAYFAPNGVMVDALVQARNRGVKVEVIIPQKFDNVAAGKASRSRWNELMDAGVQFYEYEPCLYHCKIMIVDDLWATVGSVNIDERSFHLNDEANLNILDRAFAAKLIQSFEADKAKSRYIDPKTFEHRNMIGRFFDQVAGLFKSQL